MSLGRRCWAATGAWIGFVASSARARRGLAAPAACSGIVAVACVCFALTAPAAHGSPSDSARVGPRYGRLEPDRSWADRPAHPVAGDSVVWLPLRPTPHADTESLLRPEPAAGAPPLWRAGEVDTLEWAFRLHRAAGLCIGSGDSACAESCRTALARLRSPWRWEAIRGLADCALARGDSARADSLLTDVRVPFGQPLDMAERLGRIASLSLASGDTARAVRNGVAVMRLAPALPPAREALRLYDILTAASAVTPEVAIEAAAAEVEYLAGDRPAAIRRLSRIFPGRAGASGWESGFRLAEIQRLARRFSDALATLDTLSRFVPDSARTGDLLLARARVTRDAGRSDSALALFERAGAGRFGQGTRAAAWWELGREAEQHGERARARRAYAQVESLGGPRVEEARVRLGLNWLAEGRVEPARTCFARGGGEAAGFWWAVTARDSSRAAADSALAFLAGRPGYTFYRAVARETLGVRGWPGASSTPPADTAVSAALRLMRGLITAGLLEDAAYLISRWDAGDLEAGAPAGGTRSEPGAMATVASYAYACGRFAAAIRLARRALEAAPEASPSDPDGSARWSWLPALFPPLHATVLDSVAGDPRNGVERALLCALIWKESHFDSAARSSSGAIGLTQLLPGTAAEMARALHGPAPTESVLALPAFNARYGARYLRRMFDRFGGSLPLALAAYNAGPRVAERWRAMQGAGGEALLCELVGYPETQDYVKTILAVRQAYRELRPRVGGR